MTGEVSLRGKVLAVGGLRDKALAAHRAGFRVMLYPAVNENDLEDIPREVRERLALVPVWTMDDVFAVALHRVIVPRKVGDEEIVQRCIYAMINEGARILEEGISQRASDIDMVYVFGYGFPPFRGGPMLYADMTGLINVARAMKRFAQLPRVDQAFWQPAPMLARLAAEGKTFNAV